MPDLCWSHNGSAPLRAASRTTWSDLVMPPHPERLQAGTASARSLLLTLLGEFVLPNGDAAWTSVLIAALAQLSVEEKAARQALMRTAANDIISAERHGRRTLWRLRSAGIELLTQGTDRIYSFGREAEQWSGEWLTVVVSVPESQRQRRHRLRTQLTWLGLGSLAPGVWVTPTVDREKQVAGVLESLGISGFSFVGPFGSIGDVKQVVEQAWQLDTVAGRYRDFVQHFTAQTPRTSDETFAAQVSLVHEWRRFPFVDPGLPRQLLPPRWPGVTAVELFHRRHQEWKATADTYWDTLCSAEQSRT